MNPTFCDFFRFWVPKASQNGAKIAPQISFWATFWRCFFRLRFGIDFASILGGSDPKKHQFYLGKARFFIKSTFSGKLKKKLDFDSNLEAKNTPNHKKNVFAHVSFWAIVLGGSFFRFWAILTPFWEAPGPPKSGHKCKKKR